MRLRGAVPPKVVHAAKVAAAASLLVGVVYAACVTVLDQVVASRLTEAVDARLAERLSDVREIGLQAPDEDDIDSTPVYLWQVGQSGPVSRPSSGAPALPANIRLGPDGEETVRLPGGPYRLVSGSADGVRLIAGQSLQSVVHLTALLRDGEALAAPVLLLAMFAGALTIGLRALSPVEQSRRRQLEFTADASHELRTPLSVISAETSVALSAPRQPAEYRAALTRIEGESTRLRKIVEDLLWLARFDSAPPQPGEEPLDVGTIAGQCAERFRAVGAAKLFDIEVVTTGSVPAWISAPPEWIDRLTGVLVDNACRYAGTSGTVRITVAHRGSRVTMAVEDTGPGIPAELRTRLFDRFHRSTEQGGSAGLGLAIADSIVRSTDGQWRLADSELGGALFEVSWRRVAVRQHGTGSAAKPGSAVRPEPPGRPATPAESDNQRNGQATGQQHGERPPSGHLRKAERGREAAEKPAVQLADQRQETPGQRRDGRADGRSRREQPQVSRATQQRDGIGGRAQLRSPPAAGAIVPPESSGGLSRCSIARPRVSSLPGAAPRTPPWLPSPGPSGHILGRPGVSLDDGRPGKGCDQMSESDSGDRLAGDSGGPANAGERDWLAAQFEEHREHLRAVAYRMLGSLDDADDAVQDTWLRLSRAGADDVVNLGGWLTTIIARVCLNMLRSRSVRREDSLEVRLPDPVVSLAPESQPEDAALLADSVGLALLVVLDALTPAERLAFVLHDMFGLPFEEIAPVVGRTPAAARQLASRARRRVSGAGLAAPDADLARQRGVVDAFFAAARDGDFDALLRVLDPGVVLRIDAGGVHVAGSMEVRGAAAVARQALSGLTSLLPAVRLIPAVVNGAAGVVAVRRDRPVTVIGFTVAGGKIVEMDSIADPERVRRITEGTGVVPGVPGRPGES